MTRTVIALYDDFADANGAVRELVDNGFPREDISIIANDATGEYSRYLENQRDTAPAENTTTNNTAAAAGVGAGIGAVIGGLGGLLLGLGALAIPGLGPVLAAGPLAAAITGLAGAGAGAVAGGVTGGLIGALADMGVPRETAEYYAEGIRRGGTLVSIRTPDHMTQQAVDILNHHNAIDINERSQQWRQSGWTGGYNPSPQPAAENPPASNPVSSPVNQNQPVNQPAANEKVDRPADYEPANTGNTDFPKDSLYRSETTATTDTTQEAAKPQNTDISTDYGAFDVYANDFRNHFNTTMAGTGYTYEQYQPAYRYGYDLATNGRFRNRNWDEVEPEAQRYWNERNPGTWDQIKGAVRYAWDEIKNAA